MITMMIFRPQTKINLNPLLKKTSFHLIILIKKIKFLKIKILLRDMRQIVCKKIINPNNNNNNNQNKFHHNFNKINLRMMNKITKTMLTVISK